MKNSDRPGSRVAAQAIVGRYGGRWLLYSSSHSANNPTIPWEVALDPGHYSFSQGAIDFDVTMATNF